MRKVMAVTAILCFAANCFAATASQQKAEREASAGGGQEGGSAQEKAVFVTWAGEIISIKKSFNQVVVKDSKTHTEKVFIVKPENLKSVKLGDNVEVKYKNGSNAAESITTAKPSPSR